MQRQPWDLVVVFHAEIPDVQLEQVPAALASLQALHDVLSVAVVSVPDSDAAPGDSSAGDGEAVAGDGESVGRES